MAFDIDVTDVMRMAREVEAIGPAALDAIEPVMKRAAHNVKEGVAREFRKSPHFKGVANRGRISYDRIYGLSTLGYEIGPEIGGGGSLAGIAVEGGANGGGGSVQIELALTEETTKLEAEVMIALGLL